MKYFISLGVIIGVMSFIGCSENNPTDPITQITKQNSEIIRDKINICCQLMDPLTGSCGLNGCVEYTHQILNSSQSYAGLYTVDLTFQMLSLLCSNCMMYHPEWIIKGYSQDIVNVSEEGIALVTKLYEITNRFDVVLKVTYLVTTEGAGVADVQIVPMQP